MTRPWSDVRKISLAHLRGLHDAPKNELGNYRHASKTQMAEFYALHEALPALLEVVEAAAQVLEFDSRPGRFAARERLEVALRRFRFP